MCYVNFTGSDVVSFPADFDNPVLSLTDLKSGTQYIVCLRAVNDYHEGEFGKPQLVKTSSPQAGQYGTINIQLNFFSINL